MATDAELLGCYARDRSERAFSELVQRHIDLVYSAALREAHGDASLAEDITQAVFAELARKASRLTAHPALAGWLYTCVRRMTANERRAEDRRRRREQEVHTMNQLLSSQPSDPVWRQIQPVLDDAMHELNDTDRTAIVLRFFEERSLKEVGLALGINENAARMRVDRALGKLQTLLAKRGVTSTATGLTAAIAASAVLSAPTGLAASVVTGALAATAVSAAATIVATKTIAMTTLQKTIIGAALAAAVGTGIYEARQASKWQTQVQTLQRQQASLAERVRQLQRKQDDATNRLAALLGENEQLKTSSSTAEIMKLRGQVAHLMARQESARENGVNTNQPTEATALAWAAKVNSLKDYVRENPDKSVPETQFMTERDWLASIDPSAGYWPLKTDQDYRRAMDILRDQAQLRFQGLIEDALDKLSQTEKQSFPTELAQLRPYLDPAVADVLDQQWEMVRITNLPPAYVPNDGSIEGQWMIARKSSAREHGQRMTIFPMKRDGIRQYMIGYY